MTHVIGLKHTDDAPALSNAERNRIEALLDRLDPQGPVPGEVLLASGNELERIAA